MASRPIHPPNFKSFSRDNLELSIVDCFEHWVKKTPTAIAIDCDGESITYRDLNRITLQVARVISNRIKDNQKPIAFLMDQGSDAVACVLGILRSDNIYVPLDGRHGEKYLRNVIQDLSPPLIITDSAHEPLVRSLDIPILLYNDVLGITGLDEPDFRPGPDSLAYIFFTSGTTGKPKGVVDSHVNVLHNVLRYTNTLKICQEDHLSMIQHPSFSGTVSSMFSALCNGATLCPFNLHKQGLSKLSDWVVSQGVTIYHSVPSIFRFLVETGASFPSLRVIRLEGDKATSVDADLFRKSFPSGCALVNGLGATECGLVRQYFLDSEDQKSDILPIGYPVPDMEVNLVDPEGKKVKVGEPGEILIKSHYLAVGYWADPERTDREFHTQPDGSRIYYTGDLGRWRADHCLEYLGRKDRQVKIYGQTVNLNDLESVLTSIDGVAEAAAVTYTDHYKETRIAAYLVPEQDNQASGEQTRHLLAAKCPYFMIPTHIQYIEQLPRSKNGKLNPGALPLPKYDRKSLKIPFIPPKSKMATIMAALWQEVLDVEQVGLNDNFLALGGDSIRAARLVSAMKARGLDFKIVDLYDHPDLKSLINSIQGKVDKTASRLTNVHHRGSKQRQIFNRGKY